MNRKVQIVAVMLAALAGIVVFTLWLTGRREPQPGPSEEAQLRQTIAQMEERVRNAETERDTARRQAGISVI